MSKFIWHSPFYFLCPHQTPVADLVLRGNRIKIQTYYECRRHDTPAKPKVQWGQSPKWNPGYTQTKSNIELRRSGTITRAFVLRLGSAAPLGLNKCVTIINPGLAPWAMQEYRPYRALLCLLDQYTLLFWCGCPVVLSSFPSKWLNYSIFDK